MHNEVRQYLQKVLHTVVPIRGASIIEIGSLDVNGSAREYTHAALVHVGIDRVDGAGVDVVSDIRDYVPAALFDVAICLEVIEHDDDVASLLGAINRCLVDGGWLILTGASTGRRPHSAYGGHSPEPGEYYRNVDAEELRSVLLHGGWNIIDLEYIATPGDVRCVARKGFA